MSLHMSANTLRSLPALNPSLIFAGTTGQPKGTVRDTGGYATALKYSMDAIYAVKPGEVCKSRQRRET